VSAAEQLPTLDALADGAPEWERMREQVKRSGTIPRGTYEATLSNVALVRRKDSGSWVLRMIARTDRLGRYVHAWRGLSENPDDPYDLTDGQVRGLRKFAEAMGVATPAPAAQIVEQVARMVGQPVIAKVTQTPVGQQATFTAPQPEGTIRILAPATVDPANLEGAAAAAHAAHEKIMEGLHAAHYALACAAEGCHTLLASEGWTALGFESLSEYLAAPEVTLSRSEFYRLASIWERYVLDGGLDPMALQSAGPSKLEVPLPALEAGVVSAEQAVADAASMTRADLRKHYEALQTSGDSGDVRDEPKAAPEQKPQNSADDPAGGTDDHFADVVAELEQQRALVGELEAEVHRLKHDFPLPDEGLRDVAGSLASVLRRVLDEVGRPEQKRMGKQLRAVVVEVLEQACEHGLECV
jgi:hypothetical protein